VLIKEVTLIKTLMADSQLSKVSGYLYLSDPEKSS